MAVRPIPDGYHTVTPYLIVRDAARAITFYQQALGARERLRLADPSGKIVHAEIGLGDAVIMLTDEIPEMGHRSPQALGGTPASLLLYVADVDASFERAVAAGARVMQPVKDQFYGDRSGTLIDPFGHVWTLATHTEDVPPDEMQRRFQQALKQRGGA